VATEKTIPSINQCHFVSYFILYYFYFIYEKISSGVTFFFRLRECLFALHPRNKTNKQTEALIELRSPPCLLLLCIGLEGSQEEWVS
jgi:hypothetical protein